MDGPRLRKTSAARREQRRRAEGRVVQHLFSAMVALQSPSGRSRPSVLGNVLLQVLNAMDKTQPAEGDMDGTNADCSAGEPSVCTVQTVLSGKENDNAPSWKKRRIWVPVAPKDEDTQIAGEDKEKHVENVLEANAADLPQPTLEATCDRLSEQLRTHGDAEDSELREFVDAARSVERNDLCQKLFLIGRELQQKREERYHVAPWSLSVDAPIFVHYGIFKKSATILREGYGHYANQYRILEDGETVDRWIDKWCCTPKP